MGRVLSTERAARVNRIPPTTRSGLRANGGLQSRVQSQHVVDTGCLVTVNAVEDEKRLSQHKASNGGPNGGRVRGGGSGAFVSSSAKCRLPSTEICAVLINF